MASISLIAAVTVPIAFAPSASGAGGNGTVTLNENAPRSLLYGSPATITLTATNPTATPEYNIAFTDVLPAGVTYVAGSSAPADIGEPTVVANQPTTGQTTLIWNNAADLQAGSSASVTFSVQPSTSDTVGNPYLPGGSYTDNATVYVQTAPRTLVKFNPTTGAVIAGSYTDLDKTSATTVITPLTVTKSDDQPEGELPRGVHDHKATFTLKVTNSAVNATNTVAVNDYLPASLEFLGCGGVDNTTNAPTNPGASPAVEYPGAARLTAGTTLAVGGCPAATTVETVTLTSSSASVVDAPPAQPVTPCTIPATGCAVYTHVVWNVGNLAPGGSTTIKYLAAVPLKANTVSWPGGTPATTGAQAANLNNNSGAETHDAESITNLGVATGTYQGPTTTGTGGTAVSGSGTDTVQAVDLAVQKTVDDPNFVVGHVHRFTLNYQTSEYRSATGVVVTDTLPTGLCPLDNIKNYVDTAVEGTTDPTCNARAGIDPTIPYSSVAENADTSFLIKWNLGALPKNTNATLQFSSADRGIYAAADPVASGDTVTNNVRIDGTAIAVPNVPGETAPETPTNTSSATETTTTNSISKHVAARPAANSLSATNPDCASQTYPDAPTPPVYVKGDIVCFRLDIAFPGGTETLSPTATDILPADADYVAGSATAAPANTVGVTSTAVDANGNVVFTLSDGTTSTGRRYAKAGAVFSYYIAAVINSDPAVASTADITANLLKLTSVDTQGHAISRRAKATYSVGQPQLQLTTGVQNVTDLGVKDADRPANTDHVQVKDGDIATIRVDLTNTGTVAAANASVTAALPAQITTCLSVANISNGGTCSIVAGKPVITWTGLPAIAAAGTLKLTYDLVVPPLAVAGADLSTTASIASYQSVTDVVSGAANTYVPGAGGVPTTGTTDPTDVFLASPTVGKVVHSSVTEGANLDGQATIGEILSYTITQTIPRGTTVYGGSLTDPLGTNQAYIAGSATVSVTGGVALGYVVTTPGNVLTVAYPSPITAANTTDLVVSVTFQVAVANVAGNFAGAAITNQAAFAFKDAAGTAQTAVTSNTTSVTVVEPKLTASKTDNLPGHAGAPGANVTYTVNVTDANTANVSPAHAVVVTDTLPVGMGAPTAISDGGTVSGTGVTGNAYTITWNLASLANGATKSFTYAAMLPNPVVGKQAFLNSVTVAAASLDPTTSPGARTTYAAAASDTVTPSAPPVTKTASPTSVAVGDDTTYTATVTVPAGLALPDFTAVDTLPDGMTFDGYGTATCVATGGGACTNFVGTALPTPTKIAAGTTKLAWFLGDFAAEPTVTRTITLTYKAFAAETNHSGVKPADQSTLLNSINVFWNQTNGPDPTTIAGLPAFTFTGTATNAPVKVNLPNVTLAKSALPAAPKVGDPIAYTLTLGNNGHTAAYDATITDVLPTGLNAPTGISNGGTYVAATRTITWHLDGPIAVTPNPAPTLTFMTTVDAPNALTAATITNTATVTKYWAEPAGSTLDQSRYPVYGPVSATAPINPVFPSLVVAKTVAGGGESGPAQVGVPFTWNVVVSNTSAAVANTVTVTDTLPTGWSYTAGVNTTTINGTAAADPTVAGRVLTFTVPGTVAAGTPVTISYTATPSASAVLAPASSVNTAFASGRDVDGNDHNGSGPYRSAADTASAVIASADLALTKALNGNLVPGQLNAWTITVRNLGPSTAGGPLTVTDTLPAGVTSVGATGTGWVCAPYNSAANTITCTRAAVLASGGVDNNLVVSAAVPASTTTPLTNSAVVSSPTFDPTPANNTGSVTSNVTGSADLSITKVHVGSFTAGSTGSYTIGVRNAGPSDAQAPVTVTDTLPVGESFVSAADTGGHWTCTAAGRTVTCTLDTLLAAGATAPAITLTVQVASSVTGALSNTASVSSPTADPLSSNNSATDTTTPSATDDLGITKSHTGVFTAGSTGTYTIAVTNAGPSDEPGPIVVTDTLPVGESFSTAGLGWTCVPAGRVVTCTHVGALAAGAAPLTLALTVAVAATVADGASLVNTAAVKGTLTDGNPANDTATDPTTVQRRADLALTKTLDAPIVPGSPASWTFTVHNFGPSDAAGPLTVIDTLPAGATAPGLTAASTAAGWACVFTAPRTFTCTNTTGIASGADNATLDVTATLPSGTTGNVTNSGIVSSPTTDPVPGNNTGSTTDTSTPRDDLSITKSHSGSFVAGGQGTFTITVDNLGPSDEAGPITVTDTLPAGMTFAAGPTTGGWTCTADTPKTTVTCTHTAGLTAAADPLAFDLTVAVASTVDDGTTLTNHASVAGTTTDSDPTNNTATDAVVVSATDDLSIAKTHTGDFTAGTSGTYTLTVTNHGPSDEIGPIVVVDTLPAGETFSSAAGTGWTFQHDTAAATVTATHAGGLAAGTDADPISLVVDVDSGALGTLSNSATVTGTTSDTDDSNNTATDPTVIDAVAALTLTKTHDGNFTAGGQGTYALEVKNGGPSDEAGPIVITDTLPAGETYGGSSGPGWTCTPDAAATTVTCTHVGALAAGAPGLELALTVKVAGTVADGTVLTNNASVTGSTDDTVHEASDPTTIEAHDDLAISKSHTGNFVAGTNGSYLVDVTNNGPSTATGPLTVTDTLPAGETFVSAGGTGWTCTGSAGSATITCTSTDALDAQDTAPSITVVVAVDASATGTLTNSVKVSGPTDDTDPSNNTTTDPTELDTSANLTITKSHTGTFTAGANGEFTLQVDNLGPSDATGVVVTDPLPSDETFVSATGTGWGCDFAAGTLTCTRAAALAAGDNAPPITLTVKLASGVTPGTAKDNTATVTSDVPDPDPNSNSSTDNPGQVDDVADLSIVKDSAADHFVAGSNGVYTLAVHNAGASDAAGPIVVTDALPTGESFVSATGAGWDCGVDRGTVTCTHAANLVADADAATITLTVAVSPSFLGGNLSNAASVVSGTPDNPGTADPDTSNNSSTKDEPVQTSADLSIVKAHAEDQKFTPGTNSTYTLRVTNDGPSDAQSVRVSDPLPAGETVVSATGAGWDCTASTTTLVDCSATDAFPAFGDSTITLVVAVDPGLLTGPLVNTATLTTSTGGSDEDNLTSTDTVPTITPEADLGIAKKHTDAAVAGEPLTYTLTATNDGPSDETGAITVTDTLPDGETFVSATGDGWTCAATGASVSCTTDAATVLAPGDALPDITLVVAIADTVTSGTTLTNHATVAGSTDDPVSDNNSVDDPAVVRAAADLSVVKTHTGDFTAGKNGVYQLAVHNAGPSAAAGPVTVSDPLPAGETFVSGTGTGWACDVAAGVVTCTLAAGLANGADADPITLTVALGGAAYPSVTNTATVSSPTTDPVPGNDAGSDTAPVAPASALTIVKSHTAKAYAGGTLAYTVAVTNHGITADPGPITVHDRLPAGETFLAASGSGWTCSAAGAEITCVRAAALAVGATATFTLTVRTLASAVPAVTNTATVTSPSDTTAGTSADPTTVLPVADLSLTKKLLGAGLVTGDDAIYEITVTNHGPSATAGPVTVIDKLPAGLTFVSTTGTGWTCGAAGQTVTCTRAAALADGASSAVRIVVLVHAASGSIVNRATVSSATAENPNPSGPKAGSHGDTASVSSAVTAAAGAGGQNNSGTTPASTGAPVGQLLGLALLCLLAGLMLLAGGLRRRRS